MTTLTHVRLFLECSPALTLLLNKTRLGTPRARLSRYLISALMRKGERSLLAHLRHHEAIPAFLLPTMVSVLKHSSLIMARTTHGGLMTRRKVKAKRCNRSVSLARVAGHSAGADPGRA
jgi:hypothetical protein